MARWPEGAELIENATSGAPGIRMGNVFVLAGVPRIAPNMMDALSGTLEGGRPMLSHTIGGSVAESEVAELLPKVDRAPGGCQIGSYPFYRDTGVGAKFGLRSTARQQPKPCPPGSVE